MLVDGSSYLYRAFHALPDLRTSKGEPTGALRGVLSMLRRMVADGKPDYFAVVFDAPGKTFRDDWYPQYKANRPPMPDDLAAQIRPLHELVRAHGWPLLMVEGVEADDVIGTLAVQAAAANIDTVISSSDKDLTQLVTPRIRMVNTMSSETFDEAGVQAKFGVRADQILDLLTLTGDTVDNVPGVAKVGPKTAAKWLAQYGTLDNVVAHAAQIPGVVGNNLREALPWLPTGRKLLTVKCDCTLPVKPQDLTIGAPDADALRTLYERFEFKSWLRDVEGKPGGNGASEDPAGAIAQQAARDDGGRRWDAPMEEAPRGVPPPPSIHYETVLDEAALARWLAAIDAADLVAVDTETTSLDPMQAHIVGVSLAIEPGHACYIPLGHRYTGAPDQLDRAATLRRLAPWLENPEKRKLGQNLKYDQHAFANAGLALRGVAHDTLLESYVLESHKPHDMDNLAWRHLNVKTISYDDVTGKGANRIAFEQVAVERATEYSAEDADITLRLHRVLHPPLAADGKLDYIYARVEMPVRDVLFRMERNGILIDSQLLAAQSRELGERVVALEQQAHQLAGQPFNLGSPRQLGEILFQRMNLPVVKKTATGQPSTDEEVLQELAADYPLPKVLLEHRSVSKLKSTYTDKLPQMVNAQTGRVHTTFSQATAVDRAPRVDRSQPAEHPGAHRRGTPHPRGVHRAAGARARVGRLLADRAEDHGAPVGGSCAVARVPRRPRHPSGDRRRDIRRAAGGRHVRAAPLHQGGELRPHLRHGRVRSRAAARHRARRRAAVHRQVLRALSGRGRVHEAHARNRARAGLRRNRLRAAALATRHQGRRRAASRRRRTRGDQCADAGHRRRPHQARDDRRAGLARSRAPRDQAAVAGARRTRARSPRSGSRAREPRPAGADDGRRAVAGAAGGRRRRGEELGRGALTPRVASF